jgi:hypothetical protein
LGLCLPPAFSVYHLAWPAVWGPRCYCCYWVSTCLLPLLRPVCLCSSGTRREGKRGFREKLECRKGCPQEACAWHWCCICLAYHLRAQWSHLSPSSQPWYLWPRNFPFPIVPSSSTVLTFPSPSSPHLVFEIQDDSAQYL